MFTGSGWAVTATALSAVWAAYPLLLVPSFLSLPNQPATILSGALVGIEILWLATPYSSLKGSRAQTQPLAG